MARVLLVDDDTDLTGYLRAFLSEQGQVVDLCGTAEDAEQLLQAYQYDLIVLDWTLPGSSGEQLCRDYRRRGGQTPIIFLTGRTDIEFIEAGLEAGADDYMVKPFDVRELSARIRASLKRRQGTFVDKMSINDLVLDPQSNYISVGSASVRLRPKEAALLEYLIKHPNRIYSAQQLLDAVWSADADATSDAVRTWINLLRKKLAELGRGELIRTVLGSGYIIDDKPATPP
jgi:DNA-binding response OmpR family regulator